MTSRLALAGWLLLAAAGPAAAEESLFAANEVRSVAAKDRLRTVQGTLKDGTEDARRLSAAVADAFKDTDSWAADAEAYYARKSELLARAAGLEAAFDAALAGNSPERAEAVREELDEAGRKDAVLRSDYEFFLKLPRLAQGPQRAAARAAMRLLAQTGDYPVALAYFLGRTPERAPFAPLPPGMMPIRHR